MRKQVSVPLWVWSAMWGTDLLGADDWIEAAGAAGLLIVGFIVASPAGPVTE